MASASAAHATRFPATRYVCRSTPEELLTAIRASASHYHLHLSETTQILIRNVLAQAIEVSNPPQDPPAEVPRPTPGVGSPSRHRSLSARSQRPEGYVMGGSETVRRGLPRDCTSSFECSEGHSDFREHIFKENLSNGRTARDQLLAGCRARKVAMALAKEREVRKAEAARKAEEVRQAEARRSAREAEASREAKAARDTKKARDTHKARDDEEFRVAALRKHSKGIVAKERRIRQAAEASNRQMSREKSISLRKEVDESASQCSTDFEPSSERGPNLRGGQRTTRLAILPEPRQNSDANPKEDANSTHQDGESSRSKAYIPMPNFDVDVGTSTQRNPTTGTPRASIKINIKKEPGDGEKGTVTESIEIPTGDATANATININMDMHSEVNNSTTYEPVTEACDSPGSSSLASYPPGYYPPASCPPAVWSSGSCPPTSYPPAPCSPSSFTDSGYGSQSMRSQNIHVGHDFPPSNVRTPPNKRISKGASGSSSSLFTPSDQPTFFPTPGASPSSSHPIGLAPLSGSVNFAPSPTPATAHATTSTARPDALPGAMHRTAAANHPISGRSLIRSSSLGKRARVADVDDETSEPGLKKPRATQ